MSISVKAESYNPWRNRSEKCPNKENSIKRFFKEKDAISHFPAEGEGTLSGVIVETNSETGLAKKITRLIHGGSLAN